MSQDPTDLGFMSAAHVALMNQRLAADADSLAACGELDRRYLLAFELREGPDGDTVWWQMSFDPATGIMFRLEQPERNVDVLMLGEFGPYIRFLRDKTGDDPLTPSADVDALMEQVGRAFAAGHKAAAIKTLMPDV